MSIDTLLALTNSPSRRRCAVQPREPLSAAPHLLHQPVMPHRCGWSLELFGHPDHQPHVACTLPGSGDERARAQTGGADVRLRRQVGSSWWRSKRQSAFCLQASPVAYLAAHYRVGADDVAAGSSAQLPALPCVRTWCVSIATASWRCTQPDGGRGGRPYSVLYTSTVYTYRYSCTQSTGTSTCYVYYTGT